WVPFTLNATGVGRLRGGESISQAFAALGHQPVSGILLNCSTPEAISAGIPALTSLPTRFRGAYANRFVPVSDDVPRGDRALEDDAVADRDDLTPEGYAHHAAAWLARGVNVIGGCCGVGPTYIAALKKLITTGA
ncbi:MAG: homocysteine S-methyltransferase family protein, partial [Pseudomonadales bacterium]|nr:homocysteine S-methyltransferase family protein [Pseudomonadales bacterium]